MPGSVRHLVEAMDIKSVAWPASPNQDHELADPFARRICVRYANGAVRINLVSFHYYWPIVFVQKCHNTTTIEWLYSNIIIPVFNLSANCQGGFYSCLDVQKQLKTKRDGEYQILVAGKNVSIYCHLMNTTTPKEFITLISGQMENYAEVYDKT